MIMSLFMFMLQKMDTKQSIMLTRKWFRYSITDSKSMRFL